MSPSRSEGDASRAATTAPDGVLARKLAVVCFLFFLLLNHGHFTGSDEIGVFAMTRSLVERGQLSVGPLRHTEIGRGDERYSYFAVGQSVLAIPFYLAGQGVAAILPNAWEKVARGEVKRSGHHVFGGSLEIVAANFYSPVVATALIALFFAFQRRLGASQRAAIATSLGLALTTHLATLSTYFLRHTTEALIALSVVYCFHRWRESDRLGFLVAGACLASSILLVRVPAGLVGVPLAAYLAWALFRPGGPGRDHRAPAHLAAILLPLAVAFALHCLVNYVKWGQWLSSPMVGQHDRFATPWHVGLAGLLVSPGSSVFVYSPLLLAALPAWRSLARRARSEALLIAGIGLAFLFVFAKFDGWSGLWSAPGPRYLFLPIPLLLLSLGLWLDDAPEESRRKRWSLVAALSAIGFWVQLASTGVRWGSVPAIARYPVLAPDQSGMLFEFDQSPVWVMTRLLVSGGPYDPWLMRLWNGWPGIEPHPSLAVAVALTWTLCMALASASLARTLRANAEAAR